MAEKYLTLVGLQYFYNRIKTLFANKTEIPTKVSDLSNDSNFQTESQVIIKANGIITTSIESSDTDSIASKEYVDENGGKIDVIKVNGDEQIITNKEVDITVPIVEMQGYQDIKITPNFTATGFTLTQNTDGMSVFTESGTTQLVSKTYTDTTYRTEEQVQALIDSELADITGIDFQVVDELPTPSGTKGVIYLVHKGGTSADIYDEYIWVEPSEQTPHYEKIGTTDIDLSDYWSKTELVAITTAEIDELFA